MAVYSLQTMFSRLWIIHHLIKCIHDSLASSLGSPFPSLVHGAFWWTHGLGSSCLAFWPSHLISLATIKLWRHWICCGLVALGAHPGEDPMEWLLKLLWAPAQAKAWHLTLHRLCLLHVTCALALLVPPDSSASAIIKTCLSPRDARLSQVYSVKIQFHHLAIPAWQFEGEAGHW